MKVIDAPNKRDIRLALDFEKSKKTKSSYKSE